MATRKKYIAFLIKNEKMRKKRWIKKLKRQKKLAGKRKNEMNQCKKNSKVKETT